MYSQLKDFIYSGKNPYFFVSVNHGTYTCGNKESYYSKKFPDETFSYDISNNKLLSNIDEFGTIRNLVLYRGDYVSDDIPGVWMHKDFSRSGPFFYRLRIRDEQIDFRNSGLKSESDLAENLLPRIHFFHPQITATITAFAPISSDGRERLRALVYGLYLDNISSETVNGAVILPELSLQSDYFASPDISGAIPGGVTAIEEIAFELKPGETKWIPFVFYGPGNYDDTVKIFESGTLYWLNQTIQYYKNILGNLSMENDPLTVAIFERALYQCIGAVGMDSEGRVVGSNWGTFPATSQIWMKDMYYSYLPLYSHESEFFKQGFLWFLKNGIRPQGTRFQGGIMHSLSNSLSAVIMAGLYYEATDDKDFFLQNQGIYDQLNLILEQVLSMRKSDDVWLFPSIWISDALSLGKYHTGSNICAWKAFLSMSRISGEIFRDLDLQQKYREIAGLIKNDIEKYMTMEGIFGVQYLEGIGGLTFDTQRKYPLAEYQKKYIDQAVTFLADVLDGDQINLVMHDGEESDTTLIPFYGYKSYDDETVRNYAKFTASTANPTYGEQCRGIKWGKESGATFPGYTTLFSGVVDEETMNGERGFMRELKRLNDLDGSWWWWPYNCGAPTGEVKRLNSCGKCGWAAGVFTSMFVTQILGIRYDAPTKKLSFRPFSPCSDFEWKNARWGNSTFDILYKRGKCSLIGLCNHTSDTVSAQIEIITEKEPFLYHEDRKISYEVACFLDKRTVKFQLELKPDMAYEVDLI